MEARGAIALFVKTPGLSPVKTRLAVKLGSDIAERFHGMAADATMAVIETAGRSCDVQGYYAVAEETAVTNGFWQGMPCLWQGEGGLGERMRQVYDVLLQKHDFVILVGADIPQITVEELHKAAEWLDHDEQARFSFGPSLDGGFWLFGGNRSLPQDLWADVAYSTPDTGAQFLNAVERYGITRMLTPLQDVDTPHDLLSLHEAMQGQTLLVPQQVELKHFLYGLANRLLLETIEEMRHV